MLPCNGNKTKSDVFKQQQQQNTLKPFLSLSIERCCLVINKEYIACSITEIERLVCMCKLCVSYGLNVVT